MIKHLLITQVDADKAANFFDNRNCIVATALKRKFPKAESIMVGGTHFTIDGTDYKIENVKAPHEKFYNVKDTRNFVFKPFIIKYREMD